MPIFLDRHDVVEFSAEEVAKLHVKDLEVPRQIRSEVPNVLVRC